MCKTTKTTVLNNNTLTAEEIQETIARKQIALDILNDLLKDVSREKNNALEAINDYKNNCEEDYKRYIDRIEDKDNAMSLEEHIEANRDNYYQSHYYYSIRKASVADEIANRLLTMILG